MKIKYSCFAVLTTSLMLLSFSYDSALNSKLVLTEIKVMLDGNELLTIMPNSSEATIEGSTFTYSGKKGTWEVDINNQLLKVKFEGKSINYPLIASNESEIIFLAKSIDLTHYPLSGIDQELILLINLEMGRSGKQWRESADKAQKLEIIFAVRYQ